MSMLPKWFPLFAAKIPSAQASPETPPNGQPGSQKTSLNASVKVLGIKDVASSVHVLAIGIDDYMHQNKLRGAVNDMKEIVKYFKQDLGVPESNVVTLENGAATRDGIIDALIGLSKNENIVKGSPIIIYYSGHGAEILAPPDRSDYGTTIQCLLPQDVGKSEGGVETVNSAAPIPDFTISTILDIIAHEKGNNITVIFDCCHSAGGARDEEIARAIESSDIPPLPAGIDAHIVSPSQGTVATNGFIGQAMGSHVLIAACAHAERAYENGAVKRGYFTIALLDCLRRINVDSMTYEDLMRRIDKLPTSNSQNPVCEGDNIDRILFTGSLSDPNNSFLPVTCDAPAAMTAKSLIFSIDPPSQQRYYIEAGAAQGICAGTTYSIHDSDQVDDQRVSLGELLVQSVEPFRSLLSTPTFQMPKYPCARQVTFGNQEALGVYCTPEFLASMEEDEKWNDMFVDGGEGFVLHPVEESLAHIAVGVAVENGRKCATFRIKEPTAIEYGMDTLAYTVSITAENVVQVLRGIARWSWHLRRTPVARPLESKVKLEFLELKQREQLDNEKIAILTPATNEDLNRGGVANIVVDSVGAHYGLRITNNSERDLYAYTFYFSIWDQSITPQYLKVAPNATKVVDASLPKANPSLGSAYKGNVLTVGYGSGGTKAIHHFLPVGYQLDVGIYKVFLTTQHANFDSLELQSPFHDKSRNQDNAKVASSIPDRQLWDTISLTVVQRDRMRPEDVQNPNEHTEQYPLLRKGSDHQEPISVSCRGAKPQELELFVTPPLTAEIISKAKAMKLRTMSREESPNRVGRTWFEISLLDKDECLKVDEDGRDLTVESHTNQSVMGSVMIDGQVFTREHLIWQQAEVGDSFRVVALVKGVKWKNIVDGASLLIW